MLYYSVNGQHEQNISIANRAFNYGDGVFTTAKITAGSVEFLTEHMQRLTGSCQLLSIDFEQASEVTQQVIEVAKSYQEAVLKIVVCAGQGGRGYVRAQGTDVIISIYDPPRHYDLWQRHGISLGKSSIQLGLNPLLKGLKHLNRLEQVLVKAELAQGTEDDVVVTNIKDQVIEASAANLFWQLDDKLFTADLTQSGILGIARQQVLTLRPDIKVVSADIAILEQATAMFICNAIMGIVPVKRYLGRELDISAVQSIQTVYNQARERSCESS